MLIPILTFGAAFLVISIAGFFMIYPSAVRRRLSRVVAQRTDRSVLLDTPPATRVARVARFVEGFQRMMPRSTGDVSVVQQRLVRAGYRDKNCINIFYGAKVLAPALVTIVITLTGTWAVAGFFSYIMAIGFGFLIPDFWLGNRIKTRQTSLRLGLPDALDLIVVCVEAGLGLDRAVQRTTEELRLSQPEIADELSLVTLEQRAGRSRADAWKNFAERTGVESVRSLTSVLIQADRFGSSVGKTLRAHADMLRTRRRQDAEEQAARTTVKLVFPLVVFIFPALFVVTLGPSMITIVEQMQNLLK